LTFPSIQWLLYTHNHQKKKIGIQRIILFLFSWLMDIRIDYKDAWNSLMKLVLLPISENGCVIITALGATLLDLNPFGERHAGIVNRNSHTRPVVSMYFSLRETIDQK
jgi:hypothetical protein